MKIVLDEEKEEEITLSTKSGFLIRISASKITGFHIQTEDYSKKMDTWVKTKTLNQRCYENQTMVSVYPQ